MKLETRSVIIIVVLAVSILYSAPSKGGVNFMHDGAAVMLRLGVRHAASLATCKLGKAASE